MRTAIQRKRKQERSRKKERSRLEKKLILSPVESTYAVVSEHVEVGEKKDLQSLANTRGLQDEKEEIHVLRSTKALEGEKLEVLVSMNTMASKAEPYDGRIDDEAPPATFMTTEQEDSRPYLTATGCAVVVSAVETEALPCNSSPPPPPLQHWYCSICRSRWRQEKAWRGHLLGAQHLRHMMVLMRRSAPEIRPYRRMDVAASMDPFGWGTAAGIEEEEYEDEDKESTGDEGKNDKEHGGDVGDDIDDAEESDSVDLND